MGTKAVVGNMSVQSYCPLQKILIFTGWFIVSYFTSNIHFMFNGSLETRTKDDDDDDQNMNIKWTHTWRWWSVCSRLFSCGSIPITPHPEPAEKR